MLRALGRVGVRLVLGEDPVARPVQVSREALPCPLLVARPDRLDDLVVLGDDRGRSGPPMGGGLVATGESSLFDEEGVRREDFALASLFGASSLHRHQGGRRLPTGSWETTPAHTYLQLLEPWAGEGARRHPVLAGFDDTDQLPFGGRLENVVPRGGRAVASLVEAFPVYPPETAWQREPATTTPAAIIHEPGRGRVVYLPADLDRCFGRGLQPDHARLLGNAVRWAARGRQSVTFSGPGTVDLHLYRQQQRFVLHLVNLSAAGASRIPMHEDIPVGPLTVTIDRAVAERTEVTPGGEFTCSALVAGGTPSVRAEGTRLIIDLPRLVDHEVLVLTPR